MTVRAVTDLPQPDSPTMPSVLPLGDGEVDAIDRLDRAIHDVEVGAEIIDLEDVPRTRRRRVLECLAS